MTGTFSSIQKKYLEQHILGSVPFLSKNAKGQFTADLDQAVGEELLHGTPVDELCKEEQIKHKRNGLYVGEEIVSNAEKDQFPESPDVFRYKFYGLFHVKPAQDSFMLRCRIPGCSHKSAGRKFVKNQIIFIFMISDDYVPDSFLLNNLWSPLVKK